MKTSIGARSGSDLQTKLERLKSRLAQGQRDHQRSRDELHRLKGEIREAEGELEAAQRRPVSSDGR